MNTNSSTPHTVTPDRPGPRTVLIADAHDPAAAVDKIFDTFGFDRIQDKKVFIKPNMLRTAKPESCVITDPRALAAVVQAATRRGADIRVGDNSISQSTNAIETARHCGFLDVCCGNFRNTNLYIKKVGLPRRHIKETWVSRDILEAEILISVPKFKVHPLTVFSGAVKNQYGIIPGDLKLRHHFDSPTLAEFCRLVIDIYFLRPPDLIIVDCLQVRDAGGRHYAPSLMIAGTDGFCVDYICGLLAGARRIKDQVLRTAIRDGRFDPDGIEIIGDLRPLKDFRLPFTFALRNVFAGLGQRAFARLRGGRRPAFDFKKCTRCRSCENICPGQAIHDFQIDLRRCNRCYCCIEVCPQAAMTRKFKL